jgi:hypothetical protein
LLLLSQAASRKGDARFRFGDAVAESTCFAIVAQLSVVCVGCLREGNARVNGTV